MTPFKGCPLLPRSQHFDLAYSALLHGGLFNSSSNTKGGYGYDGDDSDDVDDSDAEE